MSKFIKIRCKKCGNEQISFSHASKEVRCLKCNEILLQPAGGKAYKVYGEVVEEYE